MSLSPNNSNNKGEGQDTLGFWILDFLIWSLDYFLFLEFRFWQRLWDLKKKVVTVVKAAALPKGAGRLAWGFGGLDLEIWSPERKTNEKNSEQNKKTGRKEKVHCLQNQVLHNFFGPMGLGETLTFFFWRFGK